MTQTKGDDPDEKGHPGPPGWGLGVGLTTPSRKKKVTLRKPQRCLGRVQQTDDDLDIGKRN